MDLEKYRNLLSNIAEDFNDWLNSESEKYHLSEHDIQVLIKEMLRG